MDANAVLPLFILKTTNKLIYNMKQNHKQEQSRRQAFGKQLGTILKHYTKNQNEIQKPIAIIEQQKAW